MLVIYPTEAKDILNIIAKPALAVNIILPASQPVRAAHTQRFHKRQQ
jgi:hypothetical protein